MGSKNAPLAWPSLIDQANKRCGGEKKKATCLNSEKKKN
jgi:hypothetical protein